MHEGDSYDPSSETYTVAGVKVARELFVFLGDAANSQKLFVLKSNDAGTVVLEEIRPLMQ